MTTAALQRFAELSEQKAELKTKLKKVDDELSALKDPVLEDFIAARTQSVTLDSGRSVYIYHQWRPARREDVSSQQVADALKAAGLGDLTTANWQTLGAYIRELPVADDDAKTPVLPDGLAHVLEVNQTVEPRSRRGS